MTLNEICFPVKVNIENFHEYFKESMKTKVSLLNLVLRYITMRKGKRVRPALVFLTASMIGQISERTNIAAAMIELLHTATLVHDDVVDKAMERRGVASINAEWNNKIAVLVGDYLLSKGLQISVNNNEFEFLKVTSKAVKRMSEGELLSMDKGRNFEITEDEYFQIISDKTASLLSSCCEIGALSVSDDKILQEKMSLYGEYVGIAFQLQDDLLDYLSKSSILGKPVGNDLKEKKITLPLIYAFSKSTKSEVKEVYKKIKGGKLSNFDISEIIEFVKLKGGIDYTIAKADEYVALAKKILNDFPNSPSKNSLIGFADFVVDRKS